MRSPVGLFALAGLPTQPLFAETPTASPFLKRFVGRGELAGAVAVMMLVDEGRIALGAPNLEIHPDKTLAFVWLVRHAVFLGEGNETRRVFKTRVLQGRKGGRFRALD